MTKSKAEIRQVLVDHDLSTKEIMKKPIFGQGGQRALVVNGEESGAKLYADLDEHGNAMVMNIEMNNEMMAAKTEETGNKKGGKESKAKIGASGVKKGNNKVTKK